MDSEFVTVAICLYNGSRYICRAIETVLRQTHNNFEVVLLDDGSRDGGADLVEARFRDRRLRIIRQENRGLGSARNAALSVARGTFVAFLDQDDEWLPEKLTRQLDVFRRQPQAALVFTDCAYIDQTGHHLGFASTHFGHATIDFQGQQAVRALLARGCFIDISSVMVRHDVLAAVGGFDPQWRYVEDYDLWLRIARCYPLEYVPEPLTRRRLHDAQFTQQYHTVALTEESALLRPLLRNPTYPLDVKRAIVRYLFGQHRARSVALLHQRKLAEAARAIVGARRYPVPLVRYLMSVAGATFPWLRRLKRRLYAKPLSLHGDGRNGANHQPATAADVWVDGSPLDASRTGFFNLTVGLIRALTDTPCCRVHLRHSSRAGREALQQRLAGRAPAVAMSTRLRDMRHIPFVPGRRAGRVEVMIWNGRFSVRCARRIAVVMDLTTRLCPELHTDDTIRDFERYLTYVLRHADTIVTLSKHSRADILRTLPVFPESVHVVPVPMNPVYLRSDYSRGVLLRYAIRGPYLLCVGTREPRKNLRRLVNAFHTVRNSEPLRDHELVLAGPPGWDYGFEEWLNRHPAASHVRLLGFVPDEDLASLYHFASTVVYPSLYEGFGLPVLEAMSCSSVVLTSSVSSLPELLGPGGRYFDPRSEEDIGMAILKAARLSPGDAQYYRAYCHDRAVHLRSEWGKQPPLPGLPPAS